jgi:nicotinate dehydrogenase subunit B
MRILRQLSVLVALLLAASGAYPESLAERGAALARLGNCEVCHTARGGPPYAGGYAVDTPFGRIFGTNLTPHAETGLGNWTLADFVKAMRAGQRPNGEHLYPAFPYTHFAKLTDRDLEALFAFLKTVKPVKAGPYANELGFPFNQRALLAAWKALFHDAGARFVPDSRQNAQWNEGAYYVETVGHCGACHSPRNALGAEKRGESLAGGVVGGMYAPALGSRARPVLPWTRSALTEYLIDGRHPHHAIAAGSMQPVVDQLAQAPEAMVEAIATYLTGGLEKAPNEPSTLARAQQLEFEPGKREHDPTTELGRGESLFGRHCGNCHRRGSATIPLALTTSTVGPDPRSLIRLTLDGIRPPAGSPDKSMPAFASLSDEELVALVRYMRHRFAPDARDADLATMVKQARPRTQAGR